MVCCCFKQPLAQTNRSKYITKTWITAAFSDRSRRTFVPNTSPNHGLLQFPATVGANLYLSKYMLKTWSPVVLGSYWRKPMTPSTSPKQGSLLFQAAVGAKYPFLIHHQNMVYCSSRRSLTVGSVRAIDRSRCAISSGCMRVPACVCAYVRAFRRMHICGWEGLCVCICVCVHTHPAHVCCVSARVCVCVHGHPSV